MLLFEFAWMRAAHVVAETRGRPRGTTADSAERAVRRASQGGVRNMVLIHALTLFSALASVHAGSQWATGPANTPPMGFNTVSAPRAPTHPSWHSRATGALARPSDAMHETERRVHVEPCGSGICTTAR